MPTRREREYYQMGFQDGYALGNPEFVRPKEISEYRLPDEPSRYRQVPQRKRKLSAWNKYVKNKRNHIKYRDGKLNLKKMGVAFRRKKRR